MASSLHQEGPRTSSADFPTRGNPSALVGLTRRGPHNLRKFRATHLGEQRGPRRIREMKLVVFLPLPRRGSVQTLVQYPNPGLFRALATPLVISPTS